ncbi:PREDICTED: protein DDC8 homolog [Propithecus coquereli]|uniref:protein DDC8 homolog n=1 Tax=Propithecus coquereli TaxID=379532 RepID=UPI00063F91C4|nr:PREDICTED: protein DDC8 homolog [Propithecus coquereli]
MERAARRSPSPEDEALHLGQKCKSLQVREKQDVALQRRPDARLWRCCRLQCLAEELRAAWREAQHRHAYLLAAGGRRAEDREPDQDEPPQQGAARPPKAKERHKAALREEKSLKEEPGWHAWHPRAWRVAVGTEKQGATKAPGQAHPPPSPPEKSKGKRVSWTKTGGGRCPVNSRGSRRMDLLLAPAGEIKRVEKKETETSQEGRKQQEKGTACLVRGLARSPRNLSPEGKPRAGQRHWLADCACRRGAQAPQCTCDDKSKWQKELELTFEELFHTNRQLKKHLRLHLEPRPRAAQNPDEEQAVSESQEGGSEIPREKKAADAETMPAGESGSPAGAEAHRTASTTNLETFLSKIENRKYRQAAGPAFRNESQTPCPEAGILIDEEDALPCGTEWGPQSPRAGLLQLHPQDQAGRAGSTASRQKQEAEAEWRRPRQLELLEQPEHPNMSLEIHYMAELEKERRERRRARLALLRSYPSQGRDAKRGPGLSVTEEDWHSQMICDLQQQISEQSKLHKEFLEEARKRLREFQDEGDA